MKLREARSIVRLMLLANFVAYYTNNFFQRLLHRICCFTRDLFDSYDLRDNLLISLIKLCTQLLENYN